MFVTLLKEFAISFVEGVCHGPFLMCQDEGPNSNQNTDHFGFQVCYISYIYIYIMPWKSKTSLKQ